MQASGLESLDVACIDSRLIRTAYKHALRTGRLWRLSPEERAILKLSSSFSIVRSPTLRKLLLVIFSKINFPLSRLKAYLVGLKLVEERIERALSLGYYKALGWLLNLKYLIAQGFSVFNIPKIYWSETLKT